MGGMGMGMGFGMAQMFMNSNQQQQRQGPAPRRLPRLRRRRPVATRSPAQRLKEIKELFDAGVLSEEEYKAKRAELMKLL